MGKLIYKGAMAGMIAWPVGAITMILFLNPVNPAFPFLLKVFFLLIALFSFSLNYVVDYHQNNSRRVQLLVRYNGILPFLVLLPYRSSQLILETPDLVWFIFMLSVHVTLLNHFGLFSKARKVFLTKIGAIISLTSFGLGWYAISTGNSSGFTWWLTSIVLTIAVAIGQIFNSRKPTLT